MMIAVAMVLCLPAFAAGLHVGWSLRRRRHRADLEALHRAWVRHVSRHHGTHEGGRLAHLANLDALRDMERP